MNKEVKDYRKYYWLEKHLEEDVHNSFHEKHFLTPEEFFAIIIWKRNASKTLIKRNLLEDKPMNTTEYVWLSKKIKNLTESIKKLEKEPNKQLSILLEPRHKGIGLAIASAILTVLYPEKFTIYDWRVCEQSGIKDFSGQNNQIEKYFSEFVSVVNKRGIGNNLREKDQYLWGKSWYEDLQKFIPK